MRERLGFASAGLRAAFWQEANFRAYAGIAGAAPVAFEGAIDVQEPGYHPEIGVVKDIVAGAVPVAAIAPLVVAMAMVVDTLELPR